MSNAPLKPKDTPAEAVIGFNPTQLLPDRFPTNFERKKRLIVIMGKLEKGDRSASVIHEAKKLGIKRPDAISEEMWSFPETELGPTERMIAWMSAWGLSSTKVAASLGVGSKYVSDLKKTEVFKRGLEEAQMQIFGQDPMKAIKKLVPQGISKVAQIMNDEGAKSSTRLAAAQDILDRGLGKAVQNLNVDSSSIRQVIEALDEMRKNGSVPDITIEAQAVDAHSDHPLSKDMEAKKEEAPVPAMDEADAWIKANLGPL